MQLTMKIDGADRAVALKEVHALCSGDVYNPLVLDFTSLGRDAASRIGALTMTVRAGGPGGAVVASVPSFTRDPERWAVWRSALPFATAALQAWFAEQEGPGTFTGWLEIQDGSATYVSCAVPVILRDAPPDAGVTVYPTLDEVRAIVAAKQDALVFDDMPTALSSRPVKSGGVYAALQAKLDTSALNAALASYATTSALESAVAGFVSMSALNTALAPYATTAALTSAVSGMATQSWVNSALASYVTTSAMEAAIAAATGVDLSGYVTSGDLADAIADLATATQLSSLSSTVSGISSSLASLSAAVEGKMDSSDVSVLVQGLVDDAVESALTGYVTSAALATAISGLVSTSALSTALSTYATQSWVETQIAAIDLEDLVPGIGGFATDISDLESSLASLSSTVDGLVSDVGTNTSAISALQTAVNGLSASKADASSVYSKTQVDTLIAAVTPTALSVYTKAETDALLAAITPTALEVYTKDEVGGLFDALSYYTQAEVDALLAAITPASLSVYTKAQVDALLDAIDVTATVYTKAEVDEMLGDKADAEDVYSKTEVDEMLGDKADAEDVYSKTEADALLGDKADAEDVYSKTEVDTLVGGVDAPRLTVPAATGQQIPATGTALAYVDAIVVSGGAPVAVRVKGVTGTDWEGIAETGAASSWAEASFHDPATGGVSAGTVAVTVSADNTALTVSLKTGSTVAASATFTIPSGGIGTKASPIMDDAPVSGSKRPVTSGGVAAAIAALAQAGTSYTKAEVDALLEGYVTEALHLEDLEATRLVTAQNATAAAAAAAANLRLILDLEARIDGVEPEEEEVS